MEHAAGRDLADERAQASGVHGLGHQGVRAGVHRVGQPGRLQVMRQQDDRRLRRRDPGLPEAGDRVRGAVHVVDDDQVGPGEPDRRIGGGASVDVAQDLEAPGLAQGQPDGLAGRGPRRDDQQPLHDRSTAVGFRAHADGDDAGG